MPHPSLPAFLLFLLACCAHPPTADSSTTADPPATERRDDLLLTCRSGDSEATHRELIRVAAVPTTMRWTTELRNRCTADVRFHVGPRDALITPDTPHNTLAPGEAIVDYLADDEWVHLLTPGGGALTAQSPGGWIIFTGPGPCDAMVAVDR